LSSFYEEVTMLCRRLAGLAGVVFVLSMLIGTLLIGQAVNDTRRRYDPSGAGTQHVRGAVANQADIGSRPSPPAHDIAHRADFDTRAKPRARDIGVPFDGTPGPLNAITDVPGIEVGQTTLISGNGRLVVGKGPVRTGVTAIHPRGKQHAGTLPSKGADPVFAAWFALNGNGEMTGTTWIDESGFLEGPVLITNTHSVGLVRDATIEWLTQRYPDFLWALPVVAETYDGALNDINGFHVKREHVFAALDGARSGPVAEGNVGGGTGMICNGFKGGIGTASRKLDAKVGGYTVGVLVQCNYGSRRGLRIAGVPVGREIEGMDLCFETAKPPSQEFLNDIQRCGVAAASRGGSATTSRASATIPSGSAATSLGGSAPTSSGGSSARDLGSIIIVVATDAPLLPHQLERVVKRASLGIGREGGIASNSSGDIFVAFSTANSGAGRDSATISVTMLPNDRIDPLFLATVQATEEAITNAMVAAETMTGVDDLRVYALPHDRLREVLARYNRLAGTKP
jgi:D-aminopeptidase